MLHDIWIQLEPVHSNIFGLAFTLAGAWVIYLFRPRVKLLFGRANNSLNRQKIPSDKDPDIAHDVLIYAEKFYLQNAGRKPANSVEFVLSDWPSDVNVWRPRDVEYKQVGKGNCMLCIPSISPGELVVIDCLYLNQVAARVVSVKCSEVVGRERQFWTQVRPSRATLWFFGVSMILGIAFAAQILISLALS